MRKGQEEAELVLISQDCLTFWFLVHIVRGTAPHIRAQTVAPMVRQSHQELLCSSTCAFLYRSQSAQECQVPAD